MGHISASFSKTFAQKLISSSTFFPACILTIIRLALILFRYLGNKCFFFYLKKRSVLKFKSKGRINMCPISFNVYNPTARTEERTRQYKCNPISAKFECKKDLYTAVLCHCWQCTKCIDPRKIFQVNSRPIFTHADNDLIKIPVAHSLFQPALNHSLEADYIPAGIIQNGYIRPQLLKKDLHEKLRIAIQATSLEKKGI